MTKLRVVVDHDRVGDAWRALEQVVKPEGAEDAQWLSVWAVLHRLCRYSRYDVIRPSQEHLAKELGVARKAVRTRLDLAEKWGLISRRSVDTAGGRWSHTVFELLFHRGPSEAMDHGPSQATDRGPSRATNTLPTGEENTASLRSAGERQVSASGRNDTHRLELHVEPRDSWEDGDGEREVEGAEVPPRSKRERRAGAVVGEFGERASQRITARPKGVSANVGRRCANYFAECWEQVVYERPEFTDRRCMDGIGQASGYFNSVFFQPTAGRTYSEVEVRTMIDEFMAAVLTSRLLVKPNQSVLMRFTGAWGRGRKSVAPTTDVKYGFGAS